MAIFIKKKKKKNHGGCSPVLCLQGAGQVFSIRVAEGVGQAVLVVARLLAVGLGLRSAAFPLDTAFHQTEHGLRRRTVRTTGHSPSPRGRECRRCSVSRRCWLPFSGPSSINNLWLLLIVLSVPVPQPIFNHGLWSLV